MEFCGFLSHHPVVKKTSGVKLTSLLAICPLLDLLMLLMDYRDRSWVVAQCIWMKTLMSKYVSQDQNPLAQISKRASSMVMALWCIMDFPLSSWSGGLMATSWHTSESSETLISCSSLYLITWEPPIGQVMVWLIEKLSYSCIWGNSVYNHNAGKEQLWLHLIPLSMRVTCIRQTWMELHTPFR